MPCTIRRLLYAFVCAALRLSGLAYEQSRWAKLLIAFEYSGVRGRGEGGGVIGLAMASNHKGQIRSVSSIRWIVAVGQVLLHMSIHPHALYVLLELLYIECLTA